MGDYVIFPPRVLRAIEPFVNGSAANCDNEQVATLKSLGSEYIAHLNTSGPYEDGTYSVNAKLTTECIRVYHHTLSTR